MKAPARKARVKPAKSPTSAVAPEDDDQTVAVYGDLHSGLTQIRASSVRLVLTFGEFADGRDVLVPLVDWQTYGHKVGDEIEPAPDDKGPQLSSRLLTFDNLAFLLQDLSYDTMDVTRLLVAQSRNGVEPVADRTRYASRMLRLAVKHLTRAAERMDELLGDDENEATDRQSR